MFFYINYIFFYSIMGFLLESFFYKITKSNLHSGIFLGPYNFIYGIGITFCHIITKLLLLPLNIYSLMFYYVLFVLITTIIEYISGNLIYYYLKIDKWDYSHMKYHFGKYICLRNSLIWGILSTICIYILNPYLINKILLIIPKFFSICLIILFFLDFILSIKKYRHKTYINNYF